MKPNPRQSEAIDSPHHATVVIAGPGTGKSKVLFMRAVELVACRGVEPGKIVLLSFTNASVKDLDDTLEQDARFKTAKGTRVTTFHSLALRSLLKMRLGHGRVYIADDWEEDHLIDQFVKFSLSIRDVRDARKRRSDFDARWCQATETPDDWLDQKDRRAFQRILELAKFTLDFTTRGELTFRWWQRLTAEPDASNADMAVDFSDVLVDEYQDLNECEHEILVALSERGCRVFVGGDPNQSIYESMRHAHPELCLTFEDRFADGGTVILNESYRCPDAVLAAARALMEGLPGAEGIPSISHSDVAGEFTLVNFTDETSEASGVARVAAALHAANPQDRILILVPMRKVGELISRELGTVEHNAAFRRQKAVEPDRERYAKAFARLLGDEGDSLAAATAILLSDAKSRRTDNLSGLVKAGELLHQTAAQILTSDADLPGALGGAVKKAREKLQQLKDAGLEGAIGALEASSGLTGLDHYLKPDYQRHRIEDLPVDAGDDDAEQTEAAPIGITISTYHSSKGLEAEHVFLTGVEPTFFEDDAYSTEPEKRRLLFVGITRGRKSVFASYASRRYGPSHYAAAANGHRRGMSAMLSQIRERLDLNVSGGTAFVKRFLGEP